MGKCCNFATSTGCLMVLVLLIAVPAQAQLWRFDVLLDGAQEVPAIDTMATGEATVWLDVGAMTLDVSGTYMDLTSDLAVNPGGRAHLHGPAPTDMTAGVLVPLTADGTAASGTFTSGGPVGISQTVIDHILDGMTYLNIHSVDHGSGEIRGNLLNPVFIPEPATGLMLLMTVGVALLRVRRRAV